MDSDSVLKRRSIFIRLIITFVIIITPLYVVHFNLYIKNEEILRDELLNSIDTQIMFMLYNIESEVSSIKKFQYDIINDEDVQVVKNIFQSLDEIERAFTIRRLQKRLDITKSSIQLVKEASLHFPNINRSVSATGGLRQIIDDVNIDKMNDIVKLRNDNRNPIIFTSQEALMVEFPSNYEKTEVNLPKVICEIDIDINKLKLQMNNINNYDDDGCFLVDTSTNKIIIHTSNEILNKEKEELFQKLITNRDLQKMKETIGNKNYLFLSAQSDIIGLKFVKYVSEDSVAGSLKDYKVYLRLYSLAMLFIITAYSLSMYRFIQRPLKNLGKAFESVEKGQLDVKVEYKYKDEFGYIYQKFNKMVINLKNVIDQVYKQKIHSQRAELKQLQSQINPHFLYNSFFIVNSMTRTGDYDKLELFTEQLGEYFQYITRNSNDEVILENEVEHARTYTQIQSLRFHNRIKINFDPLPDEFNNLLVPRLIIQPILENAFEHSFDKKEKEGILNVCFEKKENFLYISVEDNGVPISKEKLDNIFSSISNFRDGLEITGLINIHKRIQLKFGEKSGLEFNRGIQGGLKVTIKIEYTIKENDENV